MKRLMFFIFVLLLALPVLARAQGGNTEDTYYPMPGEEITDRAPMIFMALPQADPPINPTTIKVTIDGSDVTSELQVNPEFIIYTVPTPLSLGNHTVIVSYSDTAGTAANPIKWDFSVVAKPTRVVTPKSDARPSTSGRMTLKFEEIELNNATRGTIWQDSNDYKYSEAINSIANFSFRHKHHGATYDGSYERTVEQITGRSNDWFKFDILDNKKNISLGDIPINSTEFSAMTITGIKMRGVKSIHKLSDKYNLTLLAGRTTEPQNGRFKRYTRGFKIDTKSSKNNVVRLIILASDEKGIVTGSVFPANDTIVGLIDTFTYNKRWNLDSEFVHNKHTERENTSIIDSGRDAASRYTLNFKSTRVEASAGRRTIGPLFTPTTLGAFTETDREGSFGAIQYKPSSRFLARTSYDAYHDNLHHNKNSNNYTDRSNNAISNIRLDYPRFPVLDARYGKLYTNTDAPLGNPDTQRSESTSANFTLRQDFNDWGVMNGTNLSHVFSRYDIDRTAYAAGGVSTVFNMRSDTRTWTISTRYKAFALFSYNTSLNKTHYETRTGALRSINETKSNTDNYALQMNLIPFKLISNINYKRSAKNTYTTSVSGAVSSIALSGAPKEEQFILGFIYYLDQSKKLNLEYEDFDREYRSPLNLGRNYDEQVVRLGYSVDF